MGSSWRKGGMRSKHRNWKERKRRHSPPWCDSYVIVCAVAEASNCNSGCHAHLLQLREPVSSRFSARGEWQPDGVVALSAVSLPPSTGTTVSL